MWRIDLFMIDFLGLVLLNSRADRLFSHVNFLAYVSSCAPGFNRRIVQPRGGRISNNGGT